MKKRVGIIAATLLTVGLVVSGCSSNTGSTADTKTTIDYWSFTGVDATKKAAEFEATHPQFDVKVTEVGTSTETATAVTAAVASGKVPDLVLVQDDDLAKLIENSGNFIDLNTLGAKDIQNDFFPWVWSYGTTTDGKQVGIPTDTGGLAIAYRTDFFAAAGLPTDPAAVAALWPDWNSFLKVGKDYTAKTGKAFIDSASNTVFRATVNQVSEQYYSTDGKLVYDTNPQVKTAFDYAIQAATSGISAKDGPFTDAWTAGIGQGDFAAMAAPGWMLGIIKSSAPATSGKWSVTTVPGVGGNWGGSHLLIPKGAKHPEAAWAYIKALQSPDAQLQLFLDHGNFPSSPQAIADPKVATTEDPFFSNATTGAVLGKSVAALKPFAIGTQTGVVGGELSKAIDHVDLEGGDPTTAWTAALASIKTAIG